MGQIGAAHTSGRERCRANIAACRIGSAGRILDTSGFADALFPRIDSRSAQTATTPACWNE
ncbi:hypothetical protein LC55x_3115 [Lysobacter capsici]|nr:hypothetical protein LC55x_3115 [Lysobacter capsici]